MSAQMQDYSSFEAKLADHFQIGSGDPLEKIRNKAWNRLQELGLPSRSTENYRYLRLRQLYGKEFAIAQTSHVSKERIASYILEECSESYLVFVNGFFHPELSKTTNVPSKAVVTTLNKATNTYGSFLMHRWNAALADEQDAFVLANTALHKEGAFIYLPPQTVLKRPMQILHLIDTEVETLISPRMHLFAGTSSEAELIFTPVVLSGSGNLINHVLDATLEDNAHVRCVQKNCCFSDADWIFDSMHASLKRNSSLKTVCISNGAASIRHNYHAILLGENSEVQLNGLWALSDKREAHSHIIVDHQAPSCRSMQLFKGALKDFSKSSFEGKILVRQAAQKTDAFQLNNNLLLSDHAHADSKPNLEIFADDVKASHGATVGQLDSDQLFYMQARGVPKSEAEALLVEGYFQEVLDKIPHLSLQKEISQTCLKAIS